MLYLCYLAVVPFFAILTSAADQHSYNDEIYHELEGSLDDLSSFFQVEVKYEQSGEFLLATLLSPSISDYENERFVIDVDADWVKVSSDVDPYVAWLSFELDSLKKGTTCKITPRLINQKTKSEFCGEPLELTWKPNRLCNNMNKRYFTWPPCKIFETRLTYEVSCPWLKLDMGTHFFVQVVMLQKEKPVGHQVFKGKKNVIEISKKQLHIRVLLDELLFQVGISAEGNNDEHRLLYSEKRQVDILPEKQNENHLIIEKKNQRSSLGKENKE